MSARYKEVAAFADDAPPRYVVGAGGHPLADEDTADRSRERTSNLTVRSDTTRRDRADNGPKVVERTH